MSEIDNEGFFVSCSGVMSEFIVPTDKHPYRIPEQIHSEYLIPNYVICGFCKTEIEEHEQCKNCGASPPHRYEDKI